MARFLLQLILAALVVFSNCANNVQAKKKVSCSCTTKSDSHKVVTKSAECKSGMSNEKCCAKAAKAWPSIKDCKYSAATTPELGGSSNPSGAGEYSNGCDPPCMEGSECVDMSGGAVTNPLCTCTTSSSICDNGMICAPFSPQAPQTYKGNVCGYSCNHGKNACYSPSLF